MINCEKCGKENAEHYKFCLGCGSEISPSTQQRPTSVPEQVEKNPKSTTHQSLRSSVVPPMVSGVTQKPQEKNGSSNSKETIESQSVEVVCTRCGAQNPSSFKFCGECGFNLTSKSSASNQPTKPSNAHGTLTLILPDGSEGEVVHLVDRQITIGREYGAPFDRDMFLSPKHVTFFIEKGEVALQDEDSLNGVYIKIQPDKPVALTHGSMFRIGQEVIRFETIVAPKVKKGEPQVMGSSFSDHIGMIRLVLGRETYGNSLCVPTKGMYLGRERGQAIFPEDGYVSALHCRIHQHQGKTVLTDLGSSNGTYIRISKKTNVSSGSFILVGQQLFRLDF